MDFAFGLVSEAKFSLLGSPVTFLSRFTLILNHDELSAVRFYSVFVSRGAC
jgi:hypothetical protein